MFSEQAQKAYLEGWNDCTVIIQKGIKQGHALEEIVKMLPVMGHDAAGLFAAGMEDTIQTNAINVKETVQ